MNYLLPLQIMITNVGIKNKGKPVLTYKMAIACEKEMQLYFH